MSLLSELRSALGPALGTVLAELSATVHVRTRVETRTGGETSESWIVDNSRLNLTAVVALLDARTVQRLYGQQSSASARAVFGYQNGGFPTLGVRDAIRVLDGEYAGRVFLIEQPSLADMLSATVSVALVNAPAGVSIP